MMRIRAIQQALQEALKECDILLEQIEREIRDRDASVPTGRLRISTHGGCQRYYYSEGRGKARKEHYISVKEEDFLRKAAQSEYADKFRKELKKQRALLKRVGTINIEKLSDLYGKMHPARRKLVVPVIPDRQEFLDTWCGAEWESDMDQENMPEIYTEKGERVRSKSEKIIADKYLSMGLLYRYEAPLILNDRGRRITIHPDFTIMGRSDLREYYHEHFGMMDDSEYASAAIRKINLYERNGILLGDRLIATFETKETPLDTRSLEAVIKRHAL